ncbi:MAG: hypothetical protein ACR2N7_09755 [Acidimicrobiia bacterium]
MTTTGYRIVYAMLGIALAVVIGGAILLIPGGEPDDLPPAVERYAPQDGDLVTQPIKVVLDLTANYAASFVIDGIAIPDEDVDSIVATGRHQFEPGPGKAIERWTPGDHTVVATWVGGPGSLDSGTVVWTFRVS